MHSCAPFAPSFYPAVAATAGAATPPSSFLFLARSIVSVALPSSYSARDCNAFQFLRGAIVGESYSRHVVAVLHSVYEIQTHAALRDDVTRIAVCFGNYRVE